MARAGKDIKSVVVKSRTQDLPSPRRSAPTEDVEIQALISTIESQRDALEQRAKGMLALQSDIMSMGKLLEEEKRRRTGDTSQTQKLLTENSRLRFQVTELTAGQTRAFSDLEQQLKQAKGERDEKVGCTQTDQTARSRAAAAESVEDERAGGEVQQCGCDGRVDTA